MRWKLLLRRFSISAPRMTVRSHMPWPLRWAVAAVVFGFSAAIALWAFEFGKNIAGLEKPRDVQDEMSRLRAEVSSLRSERDKAQLIADTAASLLKTERSAQEGLAMQLRQLEAENMSIKADLGFFERLLPAGGEEGLAIRGFQAELLTPGELRYQLLVMQNGKAPAPYNGRYEVALSGLLDGKPWSFSMPGGPKTLQVKQYVRVEERVAYPAQAVVKTAQVRVTDDNGTVRATQSVRL